MSDHVVKRGLDLPIQGAAVGAVVEIAPPATVAYSPTEFAGVTPKMAVKVGDVVRAGEVLFFDKQDPRMVFRAPAAGRVAEIRRGARRVITDVVVALGSGDVEPMPVIDADRVRDLTSDQAVETLLGSGFWGCFKTRPLDRVPRPDAVPQAIWIGAHETGPLQPGIDALVGDDAQEALQVAIDLLRAIAPKVYVGVPTDSKHRAFQGLDRVERHGFSGPHPAGDPGVQVNLVAPPRGSGQVWTLRAWDAVALGRTLLSGQFDAERVYAAVGAGVARPRLVRTLLGAPLSDIVGDTKDGSLRWIRGSVLTGEAVDPGRWAPCLTRAVHVLVDEVERTLLGWALPRLAAWSYHRSFVQGFLGTKPPNGTDMRTAIHGGLRAIVPVGVYERVVATPDIMPEFLFKSMFAGDLEESIQLGMLDLTAEEAALCTYVCPSKIEFDVLLEEGLQRYVEEA